MERSLERPERNWNERNGTFLSEPLVDLPQPEISDDLDFGMIWRELAGLRLDEVFAMSRFNSLFDTKTR